MLRLWTTTTTAPSPMRFPRSVIFAAVALLGFASFSSASAFGSKIATQGFFGRSTLGTKSIGPGSFSRTSAVGIPRGGGGAAAAAAEGEQNYRDNHDDSSPSSPSSSPSSPLLRSASVLVASPVALLRPVVTAYCAALAGHPILTNCATAAALSVTSDAIAQAMERSGNANGNDNGNGIKRQQHNASRSAWMALWGWIISGLMVHYWFVFLNGLFPVEGLTVVGALKKVGVNQLVMSPGLNGLFFTFTTYTRGDVGSGGASEKAAFLRRKLAADLVPTMKRSCAFWGTVQMVNFLLVPQRFAVLFTNVGFLLWTTYISLVGYRGVAAANDNDK